MAEMKQPHAWLFGPFELDSGRFELRRNGRQIPLERIPMELLILLVSRNGVLVGRQEIVETLWGADLHLDSEQSINTAIRKLRQTLRDDADRPKFIQTVVGKGYRFVASVAEREEALTERDKELEGPAREVLRSSRRWVFMSGLVACGLAVVGIGAWVYPNTRNTPVSLAVLPFENLTGSAEREYLSDGMTEETISLLGSLSPARLRVIARTSVMQYRSTRKPVSQIGRELGVDLLVEGSLREEGGRVRITAQLIRVRDQMHLWAQNYEGDLSSTLAMQERIASAIAEDLKIRLTPDQEARMAPARRVETDAYNAYLRGRYFWNLRDEASLGQARRYFREAIDRAPAYAAAYAGLADAQSLLAYGNYEAPTEAFSKARAAAEKALELDPLSAEAHASSGYIKLYYDWDFPGAERELRRAIDLNSNLATAHDWLGYLLTVRGNFALARREFQNALRLDPLSVPVVTDGGFGLHYGGDQQGAIRELNSALEMNPRFAHAHFWRARVYGEMGDCEKALTELTASERALGEWQPFLAAKGHFLGKCGQPDQAEALLGRFAELKKTRYATSYGIALIHAGLGQKEAALNALERAFEERSHWLVWLKLDPRFAALRDEPRFQNLVRRVGLN